MSSLKPVFDMFERQFVRNGAGYIYRKNLRGAPIRVTAAERDLFVADFRRRYYLIMAATLSSVVLGMVLLAATGALGSDADPAMVAIGFAVVGSVMIAALAWASFRINDAPARTLARRSAEGAPLTPVEVRRMTFGSLSYGTLAMIGATGFGMVALRAIGHDVWHGWGRLLWLPAIILPGIAAVQAFRKWRFERTG